MISVALIDDNRLMREGIAALLQQTADCRVVASGPSADPPSLKAVNPRVVLLDLGLRSGDSLRLAAAVREEVPAAGIIVMDLLPSQDDIVEFVHAGVSAFIMKDATLEDLLGTIRAVAGGNQVLPPEMTSTLFSHIAREAAARSEADALAAVRITPREREVVELISEGLSNKGIARRLRIAPQTVKSHVRNIMEKLTLHTRLQIAAFAQDHDVAARTDR